MAFKVELNTTPLPNLFIDEYMPHCPPAYALAYIYAFRCTVAQKGDLTNAQLAEKLNILESDVLNAWQYWQEQGILYLHEDGTIEFLTVMPKKTKATGSKILIPERPPNYTAEEMAVYLEKSQVVKDLFLMAQEHLGKLLSQNDMSVLFSFYDWLRLPPEVIDILLAYCVQEGHRTLNYIEKIAISWSEEGINTPKRAMEYIHKRKNSTKEIMRSFGISGRILNPTEESYVKKWMETYQMPLEVICIACEKTILQTGKTNWNYADSILKKWEETGIRTKEAVGKEELEFAAANQAKKAQKVEEQAQVQKNTKTKQTVKQNRFVNFEQSEWDFAELERLERERLQRKK